MAKRSEAESNFEANLRGKLKKGLVSEPSVDTSKVATSPATSAAQDSMNANEAPQMQRDAENPNSGIDANVDMEIAESDAVESGSDDDTDKWEYSPPGLANDDSDEGEPPFYEGIHDYATTPRNMKMGTIVMHGVGDNPELLKKCIKLPDGISSPEGYVWARNVSELLWLEFSPGARRRASLSQIYAMDNNIVKLYKVNEDETRESIPSIEGTCDDPYILKLCCGEAQPIPELLYNTDPRIMELRGPECLDTYIPPSELPRWLYVYDEDDLTLYPREHLRPTDTDWLASNHPLLKIPSGVKSLKYCLVDPSKKNVQEDDPPIDPEQNHATLILSKSRVMRTGRYCHMIEGQILLDNPNYPSTLRLVAKLNKRHEHLTHIENEAAMYNLFPETFFREFSGVQLIPPSQFPRRLSQVVPSFYGYYKYVDEPEERPGVTGDTIPESNNTANDEDQREEEEENGNQHTEKINRSSILLTECCGMGINPSELTQYQKLEIVSLVDRLHNAGFIHNVLTSRNSIVVQPGPRVRFEPLCRTPKSARTSKRPSFRLVSFEDAWWLGLQSQKVLFQRIHGDVREAFFDENRELGKTILMNILF